MNYLPREGKRNLFGIQSYREPQIKEGMVLNQPSLYWEREDLRNRIAKLLSIPLLILPFSPLISVLLFTFLLFSIILSLFGLGFLLSSMTHLLWLLILHRRGERGNVPVRMFRVRTENGVYEVRMKGEILKGEVKEGDILTIWGDKREGSLLFKKGFNHRINSWIKLKRSPWPKILIGLISFYTILGLILLCLGGKS